MKHDEEILTNEPAQRDRVYGAHVGNFQQSRKPLFGSRIEVTREMISQSAPIGWRLRRDIPYDSESERGVKMNEQGRDLVRIVEYQTIPPSDNSAGQGSVGQAVTHHPQRCIRGEDPEK